MGRRRAGLGDFTPGLESAKAAGIKMERAPYPAGDEGIQLSLETVARRVREGAIDPRIGELAHKIFTAAGFSGRGASAGSTRERIHSILEYVRGWLIYAPDPPGTERIASAAALACVQPGLCLRLSDCDDCVVLTGSLLGSAGIPVRIVKQDYGSGHQQHVLLEAFDDGAGVWLYADPSTDMPLGTAAHAASEQRIDPLDLKVTGEGSSGAEIITLGRPPMNSRTIDAQTVLYGGRWWHRDGLGRVSVHDGSSWQPIPLGLGECNINPALNFPPGCWSPVADGSVTQGLRYFIIAITPANWSGSDVSAYFKDWFLEGVTPRGTGSWGVRGLARVSGALGSTGAVSIAGVFKEDAPQPGPGPNPNPLPPPREPPDNGPPLGTIFLTTAAIAGGIGVSGWLLYKSGLLHAFKKHLK